MLNTQINVQNTQAYKYSQKNKPKTNKNTNKDKNRKKVYKNNGNMQVQERKKE